MQIKHALFAYIACLSSAQAQSVLSLLASDGNLTTLQGLILSSPALIKRVVNLTDVTLLAPTNQAFANLNSTGALTADVLTPAFVNALLDYHVVKGTYYAANITETPQFAHTLLDDPNYTNVTGGQVVEPLKVGSKAGFVSGLKNFAPVREADIKYDNGIIHILDEVLTIPGLASDIAVDAGLTALVGALTLTDLASAIDDTPDLTVFAPTNAAFQAIGSATGNLSVAQLTDILEYHVIKGTVAYSSLLKNESVPTLEGKSVDIAVKADGNVMVNSANVVITDVLVANGVVHVIDAVLNPGNAAASGPAYPGASSAASLPLTENVPTATSVVAALTSTLSRAAATSAKATGATTYTGGAMPTAAVGAAALLAGVAFLGNW